MDHGRMSENGREGCGKAMVAGRTFGGAYSEITGYDSAGWSKWPSSKAAAYPLGYVEGLNDARTTLADVFSILLEGERLWRR
jgi:hypothetical protein